MDDSDYVGEDEANEEDSEGAASCSACEESAPGSSGGRTLPRTRASAAGAKRRRTAQARPCLQVHRFVAGVLRLRVCLPTSERSRSSPSMSKRASPVTQRAPAQKRAVPAAAQEPTPEADRNDAAARARPRRPDRKRLRRAAAPVPERGPAAVPPAEPRQVLRTAQGVSAEQAQRGGAAQRRAGADAEADDVAAQRVLRSASKQGQRARRALVPSSDSEEPLEAAVPRPRSGRVRAGASVDPPAPRGARRSRFVAGSGQRSASEAGSSDVDSFIAASGGDEEEEDGSAAAEGGAGAESAGGSSPTAGSGGTSASGDGALGSGPEDGTLPVPAPPSRARRGPPRLGDNSDGADDAEQPEPAGRRGVPARAAAAGPSVGAEGAGAALEGDQSLPASAGRRWRGPPRLMDGSGDESDVQPLGPRDQDAGRGASPAGRGVGAEGSGGELEDEPTCAGRPRRGLPRMDDSSDADAGSPERAPAGGGAAAQDAPAARRRLLRKPSRAQGNGAGAHGLGEGLSGDASGDEADANAARTPAAGAARLCSEGGGGAQGPGGRPGEEDASGDAAGAGAATAPGTGHKRLRKHSRAQDAAAAGELAGVADQPARASRRASGRAGAGREGAGSGLGCDAKRMRRARAAGDLTPAALRERTRARILGDGGGSEAGSDASGSGGGDSVVWEGELEAAAAAMASPEDAWVVWGAPGAAELGGRYGDDSDGSSSPDGAPGPSRGLPGRRLFGEPSAVVGREAEEDAERRGPNLCLRLGRVCG